MLINTENLDTIEAGRVIDQDPSALTQDGVIGGMPRHPQVGGDARPRQVIHDYRSQHPRQAATRDLRSWRCCRSGVFAPHMLAALASVAAYPNQQRGGPVPEGFMREFTHDRAARNAPRPASVALALHSITARPGSSLCLTA